MNRFLSRRALSALATLLMVGAVVATWVSRRGASRIDNQAPRHHSTATDPETPCGPVSLAVVSHYLGRPGTIAQFREASGTGDLGVCSMADLLRALEGRGLAGLAVRFDPSNPPSPSRPMILFVNGDHFHAVLPGPRGHVVVVDPPREPRITSWPEIAPRWKGEAIVVARTREELNESAIP